MENDFEAFWAAYPKKVARGAARQKYTKALKIATHEDIIAGVERYKAHLEKTATAKQYICHASTWLHQERWTDEYETVSKKVVLSQAQIANWKRSIANGTPIPRDLKPILRDNGIEI